LIDECTLTHEELSLRVGKQRSTISNYLRLLKLPPQVQQALRTEDISMGHAKAMAGLEEISSQLMVLGEIVSKGLSVRETEKLISKYQDGKSGQSPSKSSGGKSTTPSQKSADIRQIEQQLRGILGVKVDLNYSANGSGDIRIPFKTDRELNYILDLLEALDENE